MKEKPILFSTPMVQAILEGRKTMTRRIFKNPMKRYIGYRSRVDELYDDSREPLSEHEFYALYSPYSQNDVLWVRETWGIGIQLTGGIIYKADYKQNNAPLADGEKWRPSIHLPHDAARLFLKVEAVRVERLQDITTADAINEGMPECRTGMTGVFDYEIRCFHTLWDTLNAKRGYSWDSNPWVWVIEFVRMKFKGR
jgi:hypothetical protein